MTGLDWLRGDLVPAPTDCPEVTRMRAAIEARPDLAGYLGLERGAWALLGGDSVANLVMDAEDAKRAAENPEPDDAQTEAEYLERMAL